MKRKALTYIAIIAAGISLLTFIVGTIIFQYMRKFNINYPIDSDVFGAYGDFIGGVSGTLIAFASFVYIYIGLIEQRDNFKKQRDDDSLNEYVSSFQNRILSSGIRSGGSERNGYNAIQNISKELLEATEYESLSFGRRMICQHPGLIDLKLHSDMMEQIPFAKSVLANTSKEQFIACLFERDRNERWEYSKSIFGYPKNETQEQAEVLRGFGSRIFYKVAFNERQSVYENAFNRIREKYSGFIEMYLQGIEGFHPTLYATHDASNYFTILRNAFSLHEEVLLFYYLGSRSGSKELNILAKNAKVFRNLESRPDLLFDLPNQNIIKRELNHIFGGGNLNSEQ